MSVLPFASTCLHSHLVNTSKIHPRPSLSRACVCFCVCVHRQVLYLGAAAGTTVSHVADIVGPSGCVYAVEFAHRPGRDLINMAKSRTNVIPIIEDARHPLKYRMLVGMVDTVFADVAQPDQVCSLFFMFLSFLGGLLTKRRHA